MLKWFEFCHQPAANMFEIVRNDVFPFIKNIHTDKDRAYSKYMGDAIFMIPTAQKLSQIVDQMDSIFDSHLVN